ncbi:class I SAM-dependent DNA methyltransferase [Bacillaceae bacterium W0354]
MYTKMAQIYDRLMQDVPYEEWIQFMTHFCELSSHNKVLDIGCGTGEMALKLSQLGFKVTAFDLSEEMIEEANEKKTEKQVDVHFLQADAVNFSFQQTFDLIISFCDVINYITDQYDLTKAFQNIYKHLNDHGIFMFDVHSLAYVKMLHEKQIFSEVYDDLSYIWFCEQLEVGEIHHDLTFFIEEEKECFKRFDEYHIQKTYSITTYQEILNDIGFSHVEVYHDFSLEKTFDEQDADRIFFVCKK